MRTSILRASMLLFAAGSTANSTVPLENDQGVLFVRGELNGVGGLRFVLDPGASDFLTAYGSSRIYGRPARELRIGTARVPVTMEVAAESDTMAGSIGPSLLQRYALTIDYSASTLTLTPLALFMPPRNVSRLPLSFDEYDMPVVDAAIDGRPARFELDVRAPSSMLFAPFLRRSGIADRYATARVVKRSGSRIAHDVDAISIGGHDLRAVTFWFATDAKGKFASATVAGLLGNNVWSHFVLTLDYGRKAAFL